MVEHRPVKAIVAGSSPASGAKIIVPAKGWGFYFAVLETRTSNRRFGGMRTRTEACFEHAGMEKDEVRCPASLRV